ncbi:uncharacterized protein LOC107616489 [Arachis ipaensis]|uniref:uncharacterized protein LOC107616489 n=1 Tax=Arachis ipaensis TaxID=130454 RepID=UPI0007AF9FC1|nr:uncharacterized protein LOC107616489 [Arachis ipaensis]XP_025678966.1 uncharacterized protein LOC112778915 [Arachis hypogaea]
MAMEEDDSFSESEEELTEKSMKSLRNPWWECLIVKLLGRRISLAVLTRKLEALWSKMGSIDVINIGNDFFIVRFFLQEDLDFALTGGPWKIFYHYLSIRFWQPDFNPLEVTIDRIAAWVRLPGLAIEYYDEDMLKRIENIVGRTMRVDTHTAEKCRGKFARLCVELNLTEPLVSQYSINGTKYRVEYKGLHCICFNCGMAGHEKSNCATSQKAAETDGITAATTAGVVEERQEEDQKSQSQERGNVAITENEKGKKVIQHDNDTYGPWMLVQRPTRGKKVGKMGASTSNAGGNALNAKDTAMTVPGTRFSILQEENDVLQNNPETTQLCGEGEYCYFITISTIF